MYETGNPVPSSALEDMADNAQTFDALVTKTSGTVTDRLGNVRRPFQQIVTDMGFNTVTGSFQAGATVTEYNQCLLDASTGTFYSWNGALPKVVPAGSTPATSGGIGALLWVDRTDLMLRSQLAGNSGSTLVTDFPDESGGYAQSVHNRLEEYGSVTEFGNAGQLVNNEDTTTAKSKLNPRRRQYRDKTNYHFPNIGFKTWKRTYGSYDTAATATIISGTKEEGYADVLGFTSDSQLSTYPDRDQVGLFGKTDAQLPVVTTKSTTFTTTSVTSANFASAIAAGDICYGMYIDTNESPKKSAKITAIDAGTNTLTVSAWYISGGGTGTPANGTTVYINPVTKIWGINWNVGITPDTLATDGFGFELGTFSGKADGQLSGFYATNLGTYKAKNAFWAIGTTANYQIGFAAQKCDTGMYSDSTVSVGSLANGNAQGFIARANTQYSFKVEDASSNLLSGKDGSGRDVRRKSKYTVYTNGQTIDDATVVASCSATSGLTINLPVPTGLNTERELYLKNPTASTGPIYFAGVTEDGTGSFVVAIGASVHIISDGTYWLKI